MTYRKRVIKYNSFPIFERKWNKLLETKHDRKHEYLKRVLILFESKSKIHGYYNYS
jgi:hypothetical protein